MATYPFLSPEWIDEARRIREELAGRLEPAGQAVIVNLVVTEVPFGEGRLHAHLESGPGSFEIELGHIEDADATVTLDYPTTQAIFVEGNAQIGIQAYMTGQIRVEGDVAKLITVFGMAGPDPLTSEIGDRLRDITAPAR
ncbi:MAG: hypothetical protein ACRDYD_07605 [Acidimicrobiales bacterium]